MISSEQRRVQTMLQDKWDKYLVASSSDNNKAKQIEDEFFGACEFVTRFFDCRVTIEGNKTVTVEED